MSLHLRKYIILGIICGLTSTAFAQNKTVIIKYLNPKQDVRKMVQTMTRVPSKYAQVNELADMRKTNFQNAVLDGIDMGLERAALQAAQAKPQIPAIKLSKLGQQVSLSREELQAKAEHQTEFVVQYLRAHQNRWPTYVPHSEEAALLKRITNFMEVEDPSLEVLYIQQEMIRLRASSKARSPQEILSIIRDMMHYEIVPSRAYLSEENKHTQEELELGEELAFAIAAFKVPMENNPWKFVEMQEIVDKATTYNTLRRVDPLFEGLPAMHIEDGMHKSNFPVWTRGEFAWHQKEWVHKHPFEYALAPYWEKTFGTAFSRTYNSLSVLEKEAVMYATPGLPQVADVTSESFVDYYDREVAQWIAANKRVPFSRVAEDKEEYLGKVLAYPEQYPMNLKFKHSKNGWVKFADLAYPQQLEVLLWIWQKYQIFPQNALEIIGKTTTDYY